MALPSVRPVRKTAVAAITITVLLVLGGLRAADLWWWRAQILRTADARAENAADVLSEYVAESFAAGDASLRQIAVHSRRIGGPSAPVTDWLPTLVAARAGLRGVGSISVVDANGVIRHSTQPAIIGQSRATNYVFKQLAAATTDELVVDRPFLSIIEPRQYLIPIGRRLTTPTNAFDGIVVATFTPAAQRGLFRTIDVGKQGIVTVFHPDGAVLFRHPDEARAINQSATDDPVFHRATSGGTAGVVHGALVSDGPEYISAFRVTATPALIFAVSLEMSEMLADWREQTVLTVGASLVIGTLVLATLMLLVRQMDANAAAQIALDAARRLESERLRDANDRLAAALESEQHARHASEEASRLKDEFLMTVSHELRTPLNSIYGWARMLLAGNLDDRRRTKALETIERNARTQTHLIDDLLDVSSAMGGRLRLDVRTVFIPEVVAHVVETSRPAAEAKEIRLEARVGQPVPPVAADPERLQQIIWNLVSNAIKFTPQGGRVGISVDGTSSMVEIVVSDTGPGVPPEFLPYVFEPFRQAEGGSKRRFGGLGLGLAIVRHLVELHGGTVSADSSAQGSTFRVQLPVRALEGSRAEATSAFNAARRYDPSDGL